jgi:hypothetical protein
MRKKQELKGQQANPGDREALSSASRKSTKRNLVRIRKNKKIERFCASV